METTISARLEEAAVCFLEDRRRRGVSHDMLIRYRTVLDDLVLMARASGLQLVEQIDKHVVDFFLAGQKRDRENKRGLLSTFFHYAQAREWVEIHPVTGQAWSLYRGQLWEIQDPQVGKGGETPAAALSPRLERPVSVDDAILAFLREKRSVGRRKATVRFYRGILVAFAEFCRTREISKLEAVDRQVLRTFFSVLQERELSVDTKAAYDRALRAFTRFSTLEGWLEGDPMARRERIRQKANRPHTLTLDQIKRLLQECDGSAKGLRDRAIMLLLLDTGIRAGELCSLTRDMVQLGVDGGHVVLGCETKSGRGRVVPFGQDTARAIRSWLERVTESDYVFVALTGHGRPSRDPLTASGLSQMLKSRERVAGIRVPAAVHVWRHSFAKLYVMHGGDLASLRRLMGHASLETTQIYLQFAQADLDRRHREHSPVAQLLEEGRSDA